MAVKDFDAWLADDGIDRSGLSASAVAKLEAAWRSEQNPAPSGGSGDGNDDPGDSLYQKKVRAIEEESERVAYIRKVSLDAMENYGRMGLRDKVAQVREICEHACGDDRVSKNDFNLTMLRLGRADAIFTASRSEPEASAKVIEAAVCRRAGLDGLEKHFDVSTLEASERQFKNGLSLVGLLHQSAQRNGWRGMPDARSKDFLRAAFGSAEGGTFDLMAGTTGPSTYSLPNILGNIANKYLRAGFMGVDSVWNQIASKRSVNNFQTVTGVGLNGATIYRTLAPSGEIKHATLSETTYTNRAATYAIMLGISRESLVNDDASAFTDLSRHVGRGAGLKINDLFWTAFLNNSSFFTSGNANTSTGGGSALGTADGAAINAAEQKFLAQTGADGYPIAVMPKIMLVPPTLANTARRWMGSFGFTQGGTAGLGDGNIYQGRYSVLTSPYMESSAYTGNSTAAWYLLADPNDVPVIEGVALNGRWEPTVESADADFNQLGIALRGYIDVGFSLYEYRGGVRSAGS